jgi:hypothetical protein
MAVLTEENVKYILSELKKRIEKSMGVVNAMQQHSVNFENWVQIEMCDILNGYIAKGDVIEIEKRGNVDIRICGGNNNKVAIEIKILLSGKSGKAKRLADVVKLDKFDENIEKAILWVVYKRPKGEIDCEYYIKEVSEYIGSRSIVNELEGFVLGDDSREKIKVILYLNRWNSIH